jgi:hypothetical protein
LNSSYGPLRTAYDIAVDRHGDASRFNFESLQHLLDRLGDERTVLTV